jgi:adenylosuccinate synthase
LKLRSIDFIVLGLGFGDEGKGAITDYLVEKFRINSVIRFNGGSQAAHTVVTPDGIHVRL